MSKSAEAVLAAFEELPRAEREEVVAELLRRVGLVNHERPADEDLVAAAEDIFLELDRREDSSR